MTEKITYIDARGLNCPIPLMLVKQKLSQLPSGSIIEITVTDIHAELDIQSWCERFDHQYSDCSLTHDIDAERIFRVISRKQK